MKWFKHFTNASDSVKLNKLIDELGIEGYGRYWLLLELIASEGYDGSEKVEIHFRKISAKVQIKFSKKLGTFLQKLSDFSLINYEVSGKVYKIECPILAELQDKDSKYNRKRIVSNDQDTTLEEEEDIEEDKELETTNVVSSGVPANASPTAAKKPRPKTFENLEDLKNHLPETTTRRWLKLYENSEFIERELVKAFGWYQDNRHRMPKSLQGWCKALSSWLDRSWEKGRVRNATLNGSQGFGQNSTPEERAAELARQIQEYNDKKEKRRKGL